MSPAMLVLFEVVRAPIEMTLPVTVALLDMARSVAEYTSPVIVGLFTPLMPPGEVNRA
jgi:hypothetical protein